MPYKYPNVNSKNESIIWKHACDQFFDNFHTDTINQQLILATMTCHGRPRYAGVVGSVSHIAPLLCCLVGDNNGAAQ